MPAGTFSAALSAFQSAPQARPSFAQKKTVKAYSHFDIAPPRGPGWAHELKHDGYRLQIHVRGGRDKLYTMNAADWTKRYPGIVEQAARIKGTAMSASMPKEWRTSMP